VIRKGVRKKRVKGLTSIALATGKLPDNFGQSLKTPVYQGIAESSDEFIRRVSGEFAVLVDTRQ
jgi:hypothetical protein